MTSDSNPKIPSEPEETSPQENTGSEPQKPTYTPASPTKRVLAWMGILYMLILLALNTFGLATGSALNGIAGLLLAPACLALTVIQGFKFRLCAGRASLPMFPGGGGPRRSGRCVQLGGWIVRAVCPAGRLSHV